MPTQCLVQNYMYPNGKTIITKFALNKEMEFCLLRNGQCAQMVYSPFDANACVMDSKLKKAYAKWHKLEKCIAAYIRWPTDNIIYKWGVYWDVNSAKNSINWNAIDKIVILSWGEFLHINKIDHLYSEKEAWAIKKLIDKKAA